MQADTGKNRLNISGTVSGNPTSYTIETSPVVLNNPTKTGYTFSGWTTSGVTTPHTEVVVPNGVSTGLSAYTTSITA